MQIIVFLEYRKHHMLLLVVICLASKKKNVNQIFHIKAINLDLHL